MQSNHVLWANHLQYSEERSKNKCERYNISVNDRKNAWMTDHMQDCEAEQAQKGNPHKCTRADGPDCSRAQLTECIGGDGLATR